jgi:hypothetical protein
VRQYHCEILADSENPRGERVTTVEIRLPLVIWAEFLTHRTLCRNARSNRAVPSRVLIREVLDNPFVPQFWGSNRGGMQAGAELTGWRKSLARQAWLSARYPAVAAAWTMAKAGLHKQDANRVLSPWQWIDAVATGDRQAWRAFFALRHHPAADPKIRTIAEMIEASVKTSKPRELQWGQVHGPYYGDFQGNLSEEEMWASAGACARVSYACFDGTHSDSENAALGRRLANEKPAHASPLEHVLMATPNRHKQPGPVRGGWMSLRQIKGV